MTSGWSLKVLSLSSLIYQIGVITTLTSKWVVSVSEFRCMTGEPLTEPSMGTNTARSTLHKRVRKPEREAEWLKSHSTPYGAQVEGNLPQRQVSLVQAAAGLGPFMAEHLLGRTGTDSPPAVIFKAAGTASPGLLSQPCGLEWEAELCPRDSRVPIPEACEHVTSQEGTFRM